MPKRPLKILFVSSEVSPYSKTGGLGDVAGSLPKALRAKDIDIRVVMPKLGSIPPKHLEGVRFVGAFNVHLSWRIQEAKILVQDPHGNGESVYFIENDYYFARECLYGYDDDYERFAFFTKAAIEMLGHINFKPDIIHFNDWHSGLGPTYLRGIYSSFKFYSSMKSLFTIHNLHYQGSFGRPVLWDIGLNDGYFTNGELEFHGNISFLKAGIIHSDAVSTVSQTYAHEITTPAYGYGMDGLLQKRSNEGRLFGIVNGIDTNIHDPATDPSLYVNFSKDNINMKRENKYRIQEALGLTVGDTPMFSMITRLVEQKGLDIVALIMEELMSMDIQLVVLGKGDGRYENLFHHYAHRYPHKVSANINFDSTMAQRIYAGSDMFFMPSVYEPCGLGQLFAMGYGAIPIVRKTGGLADTVQHFNQETGQGNGFAFEDYVASGLMWAIKEALSVYNTPDWEALVKNAMSSNFSWDKSADEYVALYRNVKKM
ncbi:MAG: glycogen synthase GlgA [Defluviitaleaceae bacterium]|nr:glycogen synthase GlgA [Defluviitaleaceae bacterium]